MNGANIREAAAFYRSAAMCGEEVTGAEYAEAFSRTMDAPPRTCADCVHFKPAELVDCQGVERGQCHVHAPSLHIFDRPHSGQTWREWAWPSVVASDFCGEWTGRPQASGIGGDARP